MSHPAQLLRTLTALLATVASAPCSPPFARQPTQSSATRLPALQLFHATHPAMGTIFAIDLYAPDGASADHLNTAAFDEVDRIEQLLSNYRPSSELSRITRNAARSAVTTDPETFRFLDRSIFWSRESNGAFDITVGPLLRAWGFFFHGGRIPSEVELAALRPDIGWDKVLLDPATRSVRFAAGQPLDLDPGSIGKGFAVDSVVAILRGEGVTAALISAGGSTLYAIGAPPNTPGWPVDIPDPLHPGAAAIVIPLRDTSLSTGACTEKFFIQNGHRYCHIFDPRTMRPVEGVLQSTVIDPSATDSDALSTVVFVLDASASRELFGHIPEAHALVFRNSGNEAISEACTAIHWPGNPCSATTRQPFKESKPS